MNRRRWEADGRAAGGRAGGRRSRTWHETQRSSTVRIGSAPRAPESSRVSRESRTGGRAAPFRAITPRHACSPRRLALIAQKSSTASPAIPDGRVGGGGASSTMYSVLCSGSDEPRPAPVGMRTAMITWHASRKPPSPSGAAPAWTARFCVAIWSMPSASLASRSGAQCAPLSWTPSRSDSARRTRDCGESRSCSCSRCNSTHAISTAPPSPRRPRTSTKAARTSPAEPSSPRWWMWPPGAGIPRGVKLGFERAPASPWSSASRPLSAWP